MNNYELGDIYYIEKVFEDDPGKSKWSPAIIVDIDEETGKLYTLVATTSKGKRILLNILINSNYQYITGAKPDTLNLLGVYVIPC